MDPMCRGCGYRPMFCDCENGVQLGGYEADGGYAYYLGREVYWDVHGDGPHKLNIFPQGPFNRDHDHIVLEGASLYSGGGRYFIDGGVVVYARIDGKQLVP